MPSDDRIASALPIAGRAGVYHLPAEGIASIARAAGEAGFVLVRIDLDGCDAKAECLARVARALRFPSWFGHNWDALADCLNDLSWLPGEGYVIVIEHADRFRLAAERDFVTLLEILQEAAEEWAAEGVPLWTFVDLTADGIAHLRSL